MSARWTSAACTWEDGGSEIDGRLSNGSAGVALFLVRLFAATQDGAYLHTARGALTHSLARERAGGAAHGWYQGTAGVAAACAALGVVARDTGWLDEAVSLCHALDNLERPEVFDVVGGEAGSILGLLAVHEAAADARVLAAARRLGDELLAKRRTEPDGISWNGRHAVVRNLLGMAHGAGGIALALLELFRATGDEGYFAGASEALRYEDSLFDGATEDWPDLRHGALAAYLDTGRIGALRAAVASDAFEFASLPRPAADWRYGTPGIALVRARFFELTRLERYRMALEQAAARCREHVLRTAADEPTPGDAAVFAAADALLERARVTGDTHDVEIASSVRNRAWDGQPFAPGLLNGAAGLGFFHLRVASPLIPSPLLPGPGSTGPALPSVSDATATRAAVAGALEHFPRTERALVGAGIRVQVDATADPISTTAVRERLGELVAALQDTERVRATEALALETFAYEQACAHAGRAEPLVRSLTRARPERLDHADARLRLASSARLFRTEHDWEPLLNGEDAPRRAPAVYLVHDAPGGYAVRRLDELGARLFSGLETATPVQALVDGVAAVIRTDASADVVRARLRDALRRAYEMGILEMVDPHDLTPSDVTSALCTRCGECCRVKIYIPGDAAYAEFIAAVLEAPLRASYPDMVIRHERAGSRENVVLDLGYCHHLERGADPGGPTFRCGIYESRPEVCSNFNCVAWGRLQRMGSPSRTISDSALEKVAALKRTLDGEPGA